MYGKAKIHIMTTTMAKLTHPKPKSHIKVCFVLS